MEKKMNKRIFVNELEKQTNYNNEQCMIIVNILEINFLVGKNNKDKTINELIKKLNISVEEARNIYNVSSNIIKSEIKRKILHPFRNQN